jgi:hypothetical protein
MKKIAIAALLLLIFIPSCKKEQEKLEFIRKVIEAPENIEHFMKTDSAFSYKPFIARYFADEKTKTAFINKLSLEIHKYILPDYTVYCNRERNDTDPHTGILERYHEITVMRDKDSPMLKFQWALEFGKWQLNDIFFTSSEYCK